MSWTLVGGWLDRCLSSHNSCSSILLPRKLPTRLIQVGNTDLDVRLCLSENLPQDVQYLTLSHCWGKIHFETLTRQNLQSMLSHIPQDALTKTFQDAIEITRRLGFHYIWIDSLCIIQGDLTDWQYESALMGSIYANSSLNIAAADAPDGNTGCFFKRHPNKVYGYKVPILADRGSVSETIWNCTPLFLASSSLSSNPLGSRAWTFQERFLAPRSLYFGAAQLFWECREAVACETFPNTFRDETTLTTPGICRRWTVQNANTKAELWFQAVFNYANRNLTFSNDKLVAISGVARLFASRFGTSYVAGLWKQDMEQQLVWYRHEDCRKQLEGYRAPSWSWASGDGGAALPSWFDLRKSSFCLSVDEVSVTLFTDDPFGQVSGGYLRVKCQAPTYGTACINNQKLRVTLNGFTIPESTVYPDSSPHRLNEQIFYLPVLNIPAQRIHFERNLRGLVLEQTGQGSFRRVGAFQVSHPWINNFLSKAKESMCTEEHALGEPAGVDDKGNNLYIITII